MFSKDEQDIAFNYGIFNKINTIRIRFPFEINYLLNYFWTLSRAELSIETRIWLIHTGVLDQKLKFLKTFKTLMSLTIIYLRMP